MRKSTARKILNLPAHHLLSSDKLSYHYVQMAKNAEDVQDLIFISTAYIRLQKDSIKLHNDLSFWFSIEEELARYFYIVEKEYEAYTENLQGDLKAYINRKVDRTKSTGELKKVVNNEVAGKLTDTSIQLSEYLFKLDQRLTIDDRYSIKNTFYPLYKEKQKRWLRYFYRSIIIKIDVAILIVTAFLSQLPDLLNLSPKFEAFLNTNYPELAHLLLGISPIIYKFSWEIIIGALGLAASTIVIRFWLLSPQLQYVSPRFSNRGINDLISNEVRKIQYSDKDIAKAGLFASVVFVPIEPVLTAVIAVVAGVIALCFGKDFDETKQEIKASLKAEIQKGFTEIDGCVHQWLRTSEDIARKAMMKSIIKNCQRLSAYLMKTRGKRKGADT